MIRLPFALRTSVRPLALASGRVASPLRAVTCVMALAAAALVAACDGTRVGLDGPITGVGNGPGTGPGTGGGTTSNPVPSFFLVSAGDQHTCALSETGVAWCWGRNTDGQLGIGRTSTTARPVTVHSSAQTFRSISAGGAHTCALDFNGVASCWGSNASGQLGNGQSTTRSNVPVRVAGSLAWLAISAGATHTCALAQNGAPYCWGSNSDGQLGTGVAGDQRAPVQVRGLSEAVAISAGDRFTCAIRTTGVAVCWGRAGRLGSAGASATPRAVDGTASYGALDAGGRAACAIEPSVQRASCWGDPGAIGSAGGTGVSPARVDANLDLTVVSVGGTSACALSTSGRAGCWGSNGRGQLGIGAALDTASLVPLAVAGDSTFSSISVGGEHACAINALRVTFCWGSNASGQLGTAASNTPVRAPTRVP